MKSRILWILFRLLIAWGEHWRDRRNLGRLRAWKILPTGSKP